MPSRHAFESVCRLIALISMSVNSSNAEAQQVASPVTWDQINRPAPHAQARLLYGRESLMFGDLRLPSGDGPHPVALVIHGGCWRAENDLNHISHLSEALRQRGVATWTIEYRRLGNSGGGWPGTFQDVIASANYLLTVADTYHLDLKRVSLLGHSAGGHLALWLAAHGNRESPNALFEPLRVRIHSVISLAGITDLRSFGVGTAYCNAAVAPFLGGTADEVPQRYAEVNPVQMNSLGVSVHLVHGDSDQYVPLSQAKAFERHARSVGDAVNVVVAPGAGHFDLIAPFSRVWPEVERVILIAIHSLR